MERDQASKFINDLLRLMVSRGGSDLFLTGEFPPAIKVDGKLTKVSSQALNASHTLTLARAIMNDKQAAEFERTKECNFAISPPGIGRFRVNAFMQQGKVGMVVRVIPAVLPTLDGLGLPPVLKDVVMAKRGLAILVGATGSGKSTTMRFAQLAGNATLLAVFITAQRMESAKARAQRRLFFRKLNGNFPAEHVFAGQSHAFEQLGQHKARNEILDGCNSTHNFCLIPDVVRGLHPGTDDHQPDESDRDEDFPAQAHDLVVAKTREGRTHPEKNRDHDERF